MELSSAFQVVLFILPGFAAWRVYASYVPSRRTEADAEVIVGGIAGSAGIWIVASLVLVATTWVVNVLGSRVGQHWHVDLWNWWLAPSLTTRDFGLHSIAPGIVLTIVAVAGGGLAAFLMRRGGRLRVVEIGPFRYDPNPRVWGWFLATEKGALFRIRLKSGRVIVGQVAAYSSNPNDEVLEIVMKDYSVAEDENSKLSPVDSSDGVLILRDDIELIERLAMEIPLQPQHTSSAPRVESRWDRMRRRRP